MDSPVSQQKLAHPLPVEILEKIFLYLTEAQDLFHVAQCNRAWREAANQDEFWRPVCRAKGWEHYGTIVDDLSKETASSGHAIVTFPFESVVTQTEWPGLASTCKWKELYMKARHLEANWSKNRCNVVSFEFGGRRRYVEYFSGLVVEVVVCNLAGEGNYLAGGISNGTLRIWDASDGQCRHIIHVDVSEERQALKMKNGIIAVGCSDGKIRTYSAQTGEQLHVLSGFRRAVLYLFFDGEIIVSSEDDDIRVWSSVDGACRFVFQSSSKDTNLVSADYLDKTVAGAYSNHTIRLWDAGNGTLIRTIETDVVGSNTCFLQDGIVMTGNRSVAKVWNSQTGECLKAFEVPGDNVFCEFSGEFLLAWAADSMNIKLFNLDGKSLGDTASHNHDYLLEPTYVQGNKLITSNRWGEDKTMDLWMMDRSGLHFIQQLRTGMIEDEVMSDMLDEELGDGYYVAWMSDTKLAFVEYNSDDRSEPFARVIVHHYW